MAVLSLGDQNVVYNLRTELGEKVGKYTDELLAQTWRDFSQSEEYPDMKKFLLWLPE